MKTFNNPTLSSSASRRTWSAAQWLSSSNNLLSEILGCNISNLSAIGAAVSSLCAFITFVLSLDVVHAYGWAAFCGLLSINAALPLFNEFKKGGI